MKRILAVNAFLVLLVSSVSAQGNWEETKSTPGFDSHFGWRHGSSIWSGPPPGDRVGIFPLGWLTKEKSAALLFSRFVFSGGHRPTKAGTSHFSLYGYDRRSDYYGRHGYFGYGDYSPFAWHGQYGPVPTVNDSQRFVDDWKDREPAKLLESRQKNLGQSVLLSEGMTEEEVMKAVGSPLQRLKLGEKTVWKYSGYSLLFEGGTLKEIR